MQSLIQRGCFYQATEIHSPFFLKEKLAYLKCAQIVFLISSFLNGILLHYHLYLVWIKFIQQVYFVSLKLSVFQ